MRPVVHRVLEDHSNDPSDALDMQKRYELPVYLGLGLNPFHIDHGRLSLLIEPASDRVKSTIEARIKISNVPGTWPERLGERSIKSI